MNILLIPSTMLPFPPTKGGAVQNLMRFYSEWNDNEDKDNLIVISIFDKDAKQEAQKYKHTKVNYIRIPKFLFKLRESNNSVFCRAGFKLIDFVYRKKVSIYVKRNKKNIDLIILENTPQYALQLKKEFRKKMYIHIYNDYLNKETNNIKSILAIADKIITVSDYISNRVIDTRLIDKNKVFTLHNGVELEKFGIEEDKKQAIKLRDNYNIPKDAVVVIFVARLVPEKGIKELILAFNKLENNNVHLVVVGNKLYSGSITDPFLLELKKLAIANKNRIHFTGYVPYNELPKYYAMADIGVLTSLYEEPFALAAIEYMASGLAVILSDAGGFPEMAEGNAAIIVNRKENFVEQLAIQIQRLANEKQLLNEMKEKSLETSKKYSSINYCKMLNEILWR